MTRSEFLLPTGMTVEAARGHLGEHLELRDGAIATSERRFYDTFDGLVREEGMSVVHENGRLALVEGDATLGGGALDRGDAPERVLVSELPHGALREALSPIVEVRALSPIAHVRTRSRMLAVLNSDAKTVVRITLEEPAAVASPRREIPLRARVRVTPVRGYAEELAGVRSTLTDELGLVPAAESLADEAVRAGGGTPGGTSSKIEVRLSFEQRADAAAVAVLTRLLEIIEANVPGTLADVDSEFLHDLRVSVRRSRAVQRELRRAFPPSALRRFRDEFRWLQRATGDVRDLDVYVHEFDSMRSLLSEKLRGDLEPLLDVLRRRRLLARGKLVRALASERTRTLLSSWSEFLAELVLMDPEGREDAARPIGEVAGERIVKVYRRMVRMGRAIDLESPAEAYHELRKKGKELRYLLELFGAPLFPGDVVKPMVKSLKSLQDTLGRHQDREVQISMLRSLGEEVEALPGGPAALMAMGVLVERLEEDVVAARAEYASRFEEFASRPQRRVVKETFG